jgi:hypothetical protein
MRDISDRHSAQSIPTLSSPKKLGSYLMEAGLLTADQIKVVLNDQQATGMRFGEIVVARGWLKEQTVEWVVAKVIEPDRRAYKRQEQMAARWANEQVARVSTAAAANHPSEPNSLKSAKNNIKTAASAAAAAEKPAPKAFVRREAPISKPLPSVSSSDGDVNWVG